jgi:hypothetical protein
VLTVAASLCPSQAAVPIEALATTTAITRAVLRRLIGRRALINDHGTRFRLRPSTSKLSPAIELVDW